MARRRPAARPFRLERSHRRDCSAFARASEEGGGPFYTLADTTEDGERRNPFVFCNRFANPRVKHRYVPYLRVRCNDTACRATALVNIDTALRAIGLNLDGKNWP